MTAREKRALVFEKRGALWSELKPILLRWSFGKCWYTEAREVVSDYHVDHFRPKGRVKAHPDKPTNARDDGYWWLAFDWTNYRLAGAWANSPHRVDDEGKTVTIGKWDYFPLLNERFQATKPGDDHNAEQALLLDPVAPSDASLLTFNETGRAKPAIRTGPRAERARIATEILGLNAPRLVEERRRKWRETQTVLEALQRHNDLPDEERSAHWNNEEEHRIIELMKLTAADAEFCATARACVRARARHLADRLPTLDGQFLAEPDRWREGAANDVTASAPSADPQQASSARKLRRPKRARKDLSAP